MVSYSNNDNLNDDCITNNVANTIITMLLVSHVLEILESQKCLVLLGTHHVDGWDDHRQVKKQIYSCEFPI